MSENPRTPEPPVAATFAAVAAGLARRLAEVMTVSGQPLDRVADDLDAALPERPDPQSAARLQRLVSAYRLSPFERDLVVLAGLVNEHERLVEAMGQLHPRGTPAATPAVAAALLAPAPQERAALMAALSDGPLIRAGVICMGPGAFFTRPLELAAGVWEVLRGLDRWPPAIRTQPIQPLLGVGRWRDQPATQRALAALTPGAVPALVLVTADDLDEARARAGTLCRWAGGRTRELHGEFTEAATLQLAGLHCLIRGEVPVLAAPDLDPASDPLPDHPGPVIVYRRPASPVSSRSRPLIAVRIDPPGLAERAEIWTALLPEAPGAAADLAAVHQVSPARAAEAATDARNLSATTGTELDAALVTRALLDRARHQLPSSVRLVTPTASLGSLVLDQRNLDLMDAAIARCRHQLEVLRDWGLQRGRPGASGVRLLFTGPPGTGKTYSAEVFAARLGLDLLVVDLSALVSKWLGETEKNLAAVFDAAEQSQAVLFFDEADAIFARRTETSDAHARWANLETAFLLGRIEQFDGVTVLATNLRANIDTAFGRRLDYVITFDEPDAAARERLWREHLRAPAPVGADVDPHLLARLYPVTGGVIRNASLAAAFMAAATGGVITADHVFTAMQREYEKAGRSFPGRPPRAVLGPPDLSATSVNGPGSPDGPPSSGSPPPADAGVGEAEFHDRRP